MTEIEIIKQALAESTQGKWKLGEGCIYVKPPYGVVDPVCITPNDPKNAYLIANAPTWLSSLITTIESLREEIISQRNTFHENAYRLAKVSEDAYIRELQALIDSQHAHYMAQIESQKEEIERLTLQIRRAHLSLTWSNTENRIPHAIQHLEEAVPPVPDTPEYLEAARIFLQEGEK